jgi:hypothetical protein
VTSLFARVHEILSSSPAQAEAAFARGVEGWSRYFFGDWPRGKELMDSAHAELVSHGFGSIWERDTMQVYRLMVRIYLGEIAELARLTERALYDAQARGDLFVETILGASRVNIRWMIDDAPATKRRDVDEALRRWGQPGRFQIQHWYAIQSLAQIDLYDGNPLNALRRIEEGWPSLRRSFLLRVQNLRIEARSLRAFAAIGVARQGTDREAMLALAEREGHAIARERLDWGDPIACLVRAAVAHQRRNDAGAGAALAEAVRGFDAKQMKLHAAVARACRAKVVGGDEGRALAQEADAYFRGEGIKQPEKVALVFAPTFGRG